MRAGRFGLSNKAERVVPMIQAIGGNQVGYADLGAGIGDCLPSFGTAAAHILVQCGIENHVIGVTDEAIAAGQFRCGVEPVVVHVDGLVLDFSFCIVGIDIGDRVRIDAGRQLA